MADGSVISLRRIVIRKGDLYENHNRHRRPTWSPPPIQTNPNEIVKNITFPKGTQTQVNSNGLTGSAVWVAVFTVPTDVTVKPSGIGSITTAEVPGQPRVFRDLEVRVNGVEKVPYRNGNYDVSPGVYYTVGNPTGCANTGAQFNAQPGERVECRVKNPNGESSNIIFVLNDPAH